MNTMFTNWQTPVNTYPTNTPWMQGQFGNQFVNQGGCPVIHPQNTTPWTGYGYGPNGWWFTPTYGIGNTPTNTWNTSGNSAWSGNPGWNNATPWFGTTPQTWANGTPWHSGNQNTIPWGNTNTTPSFGFTPWQNPTFGFNPGFTNQINPYFNNPYFNNPYFNNPYINNPYINNPYINNPYATNPSFTNSAPTTPWTNGAPFPQGTPSFFSPTSPSNFGNPYPTNSPNPYAQNNTTPFQPGYTPTGNTSYANSTPANAFGYANSYGAPFSNCTSTPATCAGREAA
ncbi:MAG: hypothetical protein IPJ41_14135 [Phycisphaerales bacterium]|nr:hypothetical protein [Phycisphaerales bacterium]